jgi:hypothetical protein
MRSTCSGAEPKLDWLFHRQPQALVLALLMRSAAFRKTFVKNDWGPPVLRTSPDRLEGICSRQCVMRADQEPCLLRPLGLSRSRLSHTTDEGLRDE